MSDSREAPSSLYRIELLREDNWLPWKRRITGILRDRNLLKFVDGTAKKPEVSDPMKDGEEAKVTAWEEGDSRARTQLELTLSDAQMVHIAGAKSAEEMWKQLTLVKEARGRLGILLYQCSLYHTVADESTDIVAHMTMLQQLQEQLHLMGSLVSDDEFIILLITSLPESWDQFTTAYLGANGNNTTVTSHELVAIITEENRRRQEKGTGGDSVMFSQARNQGGRTHGIPDDPDVECYNCHKKGHTSNNCWSKGGGKEGQGPRTKMKAGQSHGRQKDRANQAQANGDLKDSAYQIQDSANTTSQFSTSLTQDDWLADTTTTSHISNERRTFIDFTPLASSSITGVGDQAIQALG